VDAEAAASYECWILNLHSSDELALFFAKVDSNSFEEIKSFILDNFM
jgi:hypothetical protein